MKLSENFEVLTKGLFGSSASFIGVATSFQENAEVWLRILSLIVGIAVGIATLISIIRNQRK